MSSVLRLSLPLTLWLASFSAVYGLQGLLCSSRWQGVVDPATALLLLAVAIAVALVLQGVLFFALRSPRWRDPDATIRRASLVLAVTALVGTAWTLAPPLVLAQSCTAPPAPSQGA